MFLSLIIFVVIALVAVPTTPIGKALRKTLVEAPARRLNRITAGEGVFYLIMGILAATLFLLFGAEGAHLFVVAAPELFVWFMMFDVAAFIDLAIISLTFAVTRPHSLLRTQIVANFQALCLLMRLPRSAIRRAPKVRRRTKGGSNPQDPASSDHWAPAPTFRGPRTSGCSGMMVGGFQLSLAGQT
ncbi:MAG: hypothetical protein ACK4VY_01105 [Brevundimonas sp.]